MLKTLFRFLCFSLILFVTACAPIRQPAPPTVYEEEELTLDELLARAGNNIDHLKAITDIKIEKNNEPYSFINASVLIKKPGWVHMRMYQLGMLVRDFVIKEDRLYVLSGKKDHKLKTLGTELYNAIFWWDAYSTGEMHTNGKHYIINADNKEIYVDRNTLLPIGQEIQTLNRNIKIEYGNPVNNEGFWYPALLKIYVDKFTFTVKLKKLLKNPELGEYDFQVPAES